MTTETVIIQVSQRGATTVERDIHRIGTTSETSSKKVDLLKTALGAIGGAMALTKLKDWADGWTRVANRVALTTEGLAAQIEVQDALYNASQRTRNEVGSMSELYLKASTAAKELGASQGDILKFTEGVGQALAIQGTSATQSAGALLQLGQALGSGRVMAEEYNSILEGGYVIAKTVAENLDRAGGSVARLTRLIKDPGGAGVSSKEFFDAFMKGAKDLESTFGKMVPTISQAFTVLDNSMTRLVGKEGIGISGMIAEGIIGLANAIDRLTPAITTATKLALAYAAAWATFKAGTLISGLLATAQAEAALTAAVANGTAVRLGSAQADAMKAVAAKQAATAEAAATGATLARANAEVARATAAVSAVQAVAAQLVVERQLETVRLGAQINDTGRTASLTRLAEIRRAEAAITAQQVAAEQALNVARAQATAADTARAAAMGRLATAQAAVATTGAAAAGSTTILGQALTKVHGLLIALSGGLLANPWVALAAVIVAAGVALYAFRDDLVLVQQDAITLGDYFRATWELLGEWVNKGIEWLKQFEPLLVDVGQWFTGLGVDLNTLLNFTRTVINKIIGLWVGGFKATINIWKGLPDVMKDIGTRALNSMRELFGLEALQNDAAGAAERLGAAVVTGFSESMNTDYVGAALSPLSDGLDSLTERARKFAKERAAAEKAGGGAGGTTTAPPAVAAGVDKKAAKALDDLKDSLERILDTVDPVGAAMRELADTEAVLDKAVKAGLITIEERNKVLAQYKEHLTEALDPLGELNRELQREMEITKLSNGEREVATQLHRLEEELRSRGVRLTKEQSESLREQIALIQKATKDGDALNRVREDTMGKLQEIVRHQGALNAALQEGTITSERFRAEIAQSNVELAALKNAMGTGDNGTIFLEGIGQVLEGYTTLASASADIIGSTFQTLTDGISTSLANAIVSGESLKESMHNLSKAILTDVLGSLIKLGIQYAINAAMGNAMASASTAASVAMAATVASAWAPAAAAVSLASYGANSGPAIAGMTAAHAASAGLSIPGFKTGGEFTVGGVGGPDSRLVQFKATPGERVTIQTPAQQRNADGNGGGSPVHVHFHGVADAESFRRSESQIHSRLSLTVNRANQRNN